MISFLLVSRNKEPAFIFYPPPLVSLKYQKGQNFFEARENFSYVYIHIYVMPTPLQGGSYINIGNDAFGPVRFRVVLNIKSLTKTLLNMPVR